MHQLRSMIHRALLLAAGLAAGSTLGSVAAPGVKGTGERSFYFQEGATDAQLVTQLKVAVPALGNSALGDFEKICQVRDWLSHFIPGADASSGLDLPGKFNLDHFTATTAQMLAWCERRQAGMQCGGASTLAYRVFRLLGYEAVVINFGDAASGATHVTTLVKLPDAVTAPVWTIQDVSYNFTILTKTGQPMGYHRLVEFLVAGRHSDYRLSQPADANFVSLYPLATDPRRVASLAVHSPQLLQEYDGYAAYRVRVNFTDTFNGISGLKEVLEYRFKDSNPALIFLLPLGCSGEKEGLAMMHFAQEACGRRTLIASDGL